MVSGKFSSFEELGQAFGMKPRIKQTRDKVKLSKQRESFCKRHICRVCQTPMEYIGGNIMVCKNPECPGYKREVTDGDGEKVIKYKTSYDILDDRGAEIAKNIFAEVD